MLVLSRKTRQQIKIGENVTITILLVKGQTVRVGIEAPRNVRVLRAELPAFDDESVEQATPDAPAKAMETAPRAHSDAVAAPRADREERTGGNVSRLSPLRRRGSMA